MIKIQQAELEKLLTAIFNQARSTIKTARSVAKALIFTLKHGTKTRHGI